MVRLIALSSPVDLHIKLLCGGHHKGDTIRMWVRRHVLLPHLMSWHTCAATCNAFTAGLLKDSLKVLKNLHVLDCFLLFGYTEILGSCKVAPNGQSNALYVKNWAVFTLGWVLHEVLCDPGQSNILYPSKSSTETTFTKSWRTMCIRIRYTSKTLHQVLHCS